MTRLYENGELDNDDFLKNFEDGMQLTTEVLRQILTELPPTTMGRFVTTDRGMFVADQETADHRQIIEAMNLRGEKIVDGGFFTFGVGNKSIVILKTSSYLDSLPEFKLPRSIQLQNRPYTTIPTLQSIAAPLGFSVIQIPE
jgi:hypothetical protein